MAETESTNIGMATEQSYHRIAEAAEKLLPLLLEDDRNKVGKTIKLLKSKVIPLMRHECPLLVAVTGGGSVGKSTVFNMLAGGKFSGVNSDAGYTKRTLAAIHPSVAKSEDRMSLLFEFFKKDEDTADEDAIPVLLKSPNEMLEPGKTLYVESDNIPEQMAVLDTPDFDTGDKNAFANRDAAEKVLAVSDVLIYLFTNQTYNIKANTDFVRSAISNIGRRKVVLVYRCSVVIPEEKVVEHMHVVLRNLFPDSPDPRLEALGLYRIDESDAVARGDADPVLRPLPGCADIMDLINGLDIVEVRKDALQSQCAAIVKEMKNALDKASLSRYELIAYRDSVRFLTRFAVRSSLNNFPQQKLMERFASCWKAAQPGYVRAMHRVGKAIPVVAKSPIYAWKWLNKKINGKEDGSAPQSTTEEFEETFRNDFNDSLGKLCADLCQPILTVEVSSSLDGADDLRTAVKELAARREREYGYYTHGSSKVECSVSRPLVLAQELCEEVKRITDVDKDGLITDAVKIACSIKDVEEAIGVLVDEARRNMGRWEKIKECLWATTTTLPAMGAIAWIACTGNPVAGSGVSAWLAAYFGAGDALVVTATIPSSLKLDDANKKLLDEKLKTLCEAWLEKKCKPIYDLVDNNITSRCAGLCDDLLKATEAPFRRLQEAVKAIGEMCARKENPL